MTAHEYQTGGWTALVTDGALALLHPGVADDVARELWQLTTTGRRLGAWVEYLASRGIATLPSFAMVEAHPDGLRVLVRGEVDVEIAGRTVSARGYATWREEVVPAATDVTIRAAAADDGWLPLTGGIVRAAAVRLAVDQEVPAAPVEEEDDDVELTVARMPALAAAVAGASADTPAEAPDTTSELSPTDASAQFGPPATGPAGADAAAGTAAGAVRTDEDTKSAEAPVVEAAGDAGPTPAAPAPWGLATPTGAPAAPPLGHVPAAAPAAVPAWLSGASQDAPPAPATRNEPAASIDANEPAPIAAPDASEPASAAAPDANEPAPAAAPDDAEPAPANAGDGHVPAPFAAPDAAELAPAPAADAAPVEPAAAADAAPVAPAAAADAAPVAPAAAAHAAVPAAADAAVPAAETPEDGGATPADAVEEDPEDSDDYDFLLWSTEQVQAREQTPAARPAAPEPELGDVEPEPVPEPAPVDDGGHADLEATREPEPEEHGGTTGGIIDSVPGRLRPAGPPPAAGPLPTPPAAPVGAPVDLPPPPPTDDGDHDGETILSSDLPVTDVEIAVEPVERPAPLLELVLSTGPRIEMDRPVLLGRAPEAARFAGTEVPRLVSVSNPERDISSTHAEIRPAGGHVVVTDLNSTNGTVVHRPDQPSVRLQPGTGVPVGAGAVIELGTGVTVTVERPEGAQ